MPPLRLLALTAALALAGCGADRASAPQPDGDSAVRRLGRIDFEPCALAGAMGGQSVDDARCGRSVG